MLLATWLRPAHDPDELLHSHDALGEGCLYLFGIVGGLCVSTLTVMYLIVCMPSGRTSADPSGKWRLPFFAVEVLPTQEAEPVGMRLSASVQPEILGMMSIAILGFDASFGAFALITSALTGIAGFSTNSASLLLAVFGAATLGSNMAGGRWAATLGRSWALQRMLIGLLIVLAALAMPYQLAMVLLPSFWFTG